MWAVLGSRETGEEVGEQARNEGCNGWCIAHTLRSGLVWSSFLNTLRVDQGLDWSLHFQNMKKKKNRPDPIGLVYYSYIAVHKPVSTSSEPNQVLTSHQPVRTNYLLLVHHVMNGKVKQNKKTKIKSTCNPPHKQWLTRLEAGAAVFLVCVHCSPGIQSSHHCSHLSFVVCHLLFPCHCMGLLFPGLVSPLSFHPHRWCQLHWPIILILINVRYRCLSVKFVYRSIYEG